MKNVELAKDVSLSPVALGFWRFLEHNTTKDEFIQFIESVLDLGITTMDHADSYGRYKAEKKFGDFLSGREDIRQQMQFVTKVGLVYQSEKARVKYYDNKKDYIVSQAENSLKNLGINEIDLLLLHRPDWYSDPAEIADAFDILYQQGKVKAFGVSNYLPHEYRKLESYLNVPIVTNQIELSILNYENFENGTIDLCMEKRIHPMIWSPLAGGKMFTSNDERIVELRNVLEVIREEIGAAAIDEVAFAWITSHPAKMIPITGSYDLEYVKRPVEALKYHLTAEQWYMIWTAVKGHRVP
ncbi:MAG: aldo/keto reductase [Ruoffia tabacinasalis]